MVAVLVKVVKFIVYASARKMVVRRSVFDRPPRWSVDRSAASARRRDSGITGYTAYVMVTKLHGLCRGHQPARLMPWSPTYTSWSPIYMAYVVVTNRTSSLSRGLLQYERFLVGGGSKLLLYTQAPSISSNLL